MNATLWKNKLRHTAVLVIAHGILILACKETKTKLIDPFHFKSAVQSIVLAHNQAGLAALHLNEAAEVTHGYSHVLIDSPSLGLLLRYIISNFAGVKLDFADSISLSENGCLDELYFQQLFRHNSQESDGNMSVRSLNNNHPPRRGEEDQERISQVLFSMNTRGLISSRSDVIALLSGELLELRVEKSYLF